MKSFTAFSRRLMLSLLVAFWTTSLIYATWRVIRDRANTSAVGLQELYLPVLAHRFSLTLLFALQLSLCASTILLAAWEIRCNRFPHGLDVPPQH